jgi:hypothetical protein
MSRHFSNTRPAIGLLIISLLVPRLGHAQTTTDLWEGEAFEKLRRSAARFKAVPVKEAVEEFQRQLQACRDGLPYDSLTENVFAHIEREREGLLRWDREVTLGLANKGPGRIITLSPMVVYLGDLKSLQADFDIAHERLELALFKAGRSSVEFARAWGKAQSVIDDAVSATRDLAIELGYAGAEVIASMPKP